MQHRTAVKADVEAGLDASKQAPGTVEGLTLDRASDKAIALSDRSNAQASSTERLESLNVPTCGRPLSAAARLGACLVTINLKLAVYNESPWNCQTNRNDLFVCHCSSSSCQAAE